MQLLPSLWSAPSSLWQELSVQHQLTWLPVTQQSRRCWARHSQQHKIQHTAQKCGSSYGSGSQVDTAPLTPLFQPPSLLLIPVSYFPSFCLCVPLPSITYLPHHRLLCSTVQVFRGSCPNPKTGCSYSSAASSPERKKFHYFNICSHPNLRKKTLGLEPLCRSSQVQKKPNNPTTNSYLRTPVHIVSFEVEYFHITETKVGSFWFGDLTWEILFWVSTLLNCIIPTTLHCLRLCSLAAW